MENTFQANDDDYIDACPPQTIVDSMKRAMEGSAPYYAHIWHGPVSSESPILSFACFPGIGVFVSYSLHMRTWTYVDSNDFAASYPIDWGQDRAVIPQAYITPFDIAERIVTYFCDTGRTADDSHWQDTASLSWNVYDE